MVCQKSIQNFISTLDLNSKESIPTKFTSIEDFNKYMNNETNHKVDVYNEDDIIQIVDKLFELNEKENAQLICNNFFRKGIWFLRDIEKKHSENKKVEDE